MKDDEGLGFDGTSERIGTAITDDDAIARREVDEFWEAVCGEEYPSDGFVRGFVEGAIELWHEVKDQI